MDTYHETLVPGLDLLLGEVGVLHQKLHVLLRQLLAAVAHDDCFSSLLIQQPFADSACYSFNLPLIQRVTDSAYCCFSKLLLELVAASACCSCFSTFQLQPIAASVRYFQGFDFKNTLSQTHCCSWL